jgi:phosphate transport system substrate-binding protein
MLNKFGSETRLPLTAAFSLSAVMAAMVAIAPSAQAQACVASPNGTPSATCAQYFAGGATFPLLLNRQFFDYYGIAIPTGPIIISGQGSTATGVQPINPAGSPRNVNQQFNYCGTGSGNGRAIFTGVPATSATSASCSYATASDGAGNATAFAAFPTNTAGVTPLFAGTDAAISATNINDYTAQKLATRGNPIQIPTVHGAIVFANNPTFGNLTITTAQLCGIFAGDPTATINGVAPHVFIRSDNSGTTTALTAYLAAACPSVSGGSYYITAATGVFPTVAQTSNFTRANGNDGVAALINGNPTGVGYLEASFGQPYAPTPAPLIASLQNPVSGSFIFPTPTTINRGLTGLGIARNSTYTCVLTATGIPVVPTVGNAYPIIATTYSLVYSRYSTAAEATAIRNVHNFVLGNRIVPFPAANDQIAGGLGFSVLTNNGAAIEVPVGSGNFLTGVSAINNLRGIARGCLTGVTSP